MTGKLYTLALVVALGACRKEEPATEEPSEPPATKSVKAPWTPKPMGGTGGGPAEELSATPPPTPAPASPGPPSKPSTVAPSSAPSSAPSVPLPWVKGDAGASWPFPWAPPSAAPSTFPWPSGS